MDKATLKALNGSIKKWEGIVAGRVADKGPENCPLCMKFHRPPNNYFYCNGCPVREATRRRFCNGTPYQDWLKALKKNRPEFGDNKATDDETVMCAVLELEFLKSLLPSKRRKS